jgi:hypothetical protein
MDESQVQFEEAFDELDKSSSSRFRPWIAPAWFLLGVLVGVLGFALFATLAAKPAVNTVAMREAARDGTLDAIATLQAGGPQPESRNPDPPATQKAFAVREANRVGVKSARVTIVEFSDFQ